MAFTLVVMSFPVLFSIVYGGFVVSLGTNPILAFAASGAFIVHFSRRPPLAECAVTLPSRCFFVCSTRWVFTASEYTTELRHCLGQFSGPGKSGYVADSCRALRGP